MSALEGPLLIVGLGNPGTKYKSTRHNAGFMVLDAFAQEKSTTFALKKQFVAHVATALCQESKVLLVKPETYMNLSGESVIKIMNYYHIPAGHVLVVVDDIYLPVGQIRFREKGSAAGHNGLKSIEKHLGTNEYARLKVGVGSPHEEADLTDYVLGNMSKNETEIIEKAIASSVDFLNQYIGKISQNELK